MTTNEGQTARGAYLQKRSDIARVLDWLDLELERHGDDSKQKPKDWSFAGDLGHVREKLIEVLSFLSGTETKAIEDLLEE